MHELARHRYLDAMGIDSYVPRRLLPAAPAALLCDLGWLDLASAPTASASPSPAAPLPAPTAAPSLLQERLLQDSVVQGSVQQKSALQDMLATQPMLIKNTASTRPVVARALEPAAPPQSLQVNVWSLAPDLLVLADRQVQKALPVAELLQNLVSALGRPVPTDLTPEVVRWPLEGIKPEHSGAPEDYLKSLLAARAPAATGERILLCFGSAVGGLLCPGQAGIRRAQLALTEQRQLTCFLLPALEELLEQPELKRPVWQLLQALR